MPEPASRSVPRLTVVVGTRPEAIKLAPVVLALRALGKVRVRLCATGQHEELLADALGAFDLVPDAWLRRAAPTRNLAQLTAELLNLLANDLATCAPELVVVQGDTTSALAGALAAFYARVPIAHVEAGLRSFNLGAPWPEEANRNLISRIATRHFAPTATSRDHLLREGIAEERIEVTGNPVVDALQATHARVLERPPEVKGLPAALRTNPSRRLVLVTSHRRENFGAPLERICTALATLAARFRDIEFIYPLHLNPQVREPVERFLGFTHPNLHLIDPLPYLPFVWLMQRATLILSDSGGVQEEAPCLGKPLLVLRDTTERPEAVAAGNVAVVGTDPERIATAASELLTDRAAYARMAVVRSPYGDGHAAPRIARSCLDLAARGQT